MIAAVTISDNPDNPNDGDIVDVLDIAVDDILGPDGLPYDRDTVMAALRSLRDQYDDAVRAGTHTRDSHYKAVVGPTSLYSISDNELAEHIMDDAKTSALNSLEFNHNEIAIFRVLVGFHNDDEEEIWDKVGCARKEWEALAEKLDA